MKIHKIIKFAVIALIAGTALSACAAKQSGFPPESEMRELLKSHALVVAYQNGTYKTYDQNGIKPLFIHLEENGSFKGARVFDKVTGKASAMVLAYGGAEKLHTGILSKEAIPVLEKYNIEYSADETVDYIVNRDKTDKCPMEKTVQEIEDPAQAFTALKERFGN